MRKLSRSRIAAAKAGIPAHITPRGGHFAGFLPAFGPLRAHLCRRATSPHVQIGQPAITHLREASQPLHDREHMLDPGTDLRLVAVLAARHLVDDVLAARALVGEVTCLRGPAVNQCFLARVCAVTVDALLLTVQQLWQRMLVVYVCGRHDRAMSQPALTVHTDVQLHAEIPLLALARLMHFGVTRLLLVLRRRGCTDERGIHNRATLELCSAR